MSKQATITLHDQELEYLIALLNQRLREGRPLADDLRTSSILVKSNVATTTRE